MNEYEEYYDGGGTLLFSLFAWIILCSFAASLFWLKERIFKEDKKISKMKFDAVYIASMAGAIQGIMLFIPVQILVLFVISLFPEDFRSDEIFWSTKVTVVVTYFACVFTCAIRWLLSQERIEVDLDKEWRA